MTAFAFSYLGKGCSPRLLPKRHWVDFEIEPTLLVSPTSLDRPMVTVRPRLAVMLLAMSVG